MLQRVWSFYDLPENRGEYERAMEEFFADVLALPEGERHIDEDDEKRCNEWFLYDFRLKNSLSPLQYFYEKNKSAISLEDSAVYEDLIKWNLYGFFKILSVKVGEEMEVRPLGEQKTYVVKESLGTFGAEEGRWLIARIAKVAGHYEFVSGVLSAPSFSFDAPSEKHFKKIFRDLNPKKVRELFLKNENGEFTREESAGNENVSEDDLLSFKEVEKKLGALLKKHGISAYVSLDRVKQWADELNPDDPYYLAPVGLIIGLAEDSPDDGDEALSEIFPVLQTFLNKLPRKDFEGKSPEQMNILRGALGEDEERDYRLSMTQFGAWRDEYHKGIELFKRNEAEKSLTAYRKTIAALLNERTTFREVFRLFANTGVTFLMNGYEYAGKRMLEISLELNPHYDFAQKQLERYEAGEYEALICEGLSERAKKISERESKVKRKRGQRRPPDADLSIIAVARMLELMAEKESGEKSPFRKIREKPDRRFAPFEKFEIKNFEDWPEYEYYLFLKKFSINFNHLLTAPTPVTIVPRDGEKIGRNASCPCGSGKKFKKCHGA